MPARRRFLAIAGLVCLALSGPVQAQVQAEVPRRVIVSFSILADIASVIGGERLDVTTLVPAGADAHMFQPTPGDAKALARADILISSGLNFEPWLDRLVTASGFRGQWIVASRGIRARSAAGHQHGSGDGHNHGPGAGGRADDPHVWQDLRLMQQYVETIATGLAGADPAHAAGYRSRAAAYRAELAALDAWATAEIETVARAHRRVISQHDAFGYLADRYLIEFMAPQGINTGSEASAEQVGRLVRQIRRSRVQAVFFESIANPRLMEQIAKEANVRLGGRLYSDALSPPGGEADSFLKMYRLNIVRLVEAMRRSS